MPFDLQPVLEGKLLRLRPLREEDYDALFSVASDPLIWEQHPSSDRWKPEVVRTFFEEGLACGGAFAVIDLKSGEIIGSSRYDHLDESEGEIEVGWTFLARSHWGGSYNREMKRLMLAHAFQFVGEVVLVIGPNNIRSRRAAEKIGGVFAGNRINSAGRESVYYRLTADVLPLLES